MTSARAGLVDVLNALRPTEHPELRYEMLSDAIYWSDEIPSLDILTSDEDALRRFKDVLRYRTSLISGAANDELKASWEAFKQLCPMWPGFAVERCCPNDQLADEYRRRHAAAIEAFRALPD